MLPAWGDAESCKDGKFAVLGIKLPERFEIVALVGFYKMLYKGFFIIIHYVQGSMDGNVVRDISNSSQKVETVDNVA
jgi:hypothetical protein